MGRLLTSSLIFFLWLPAGLAHSDVPLQGDIRFHPQRQGATWVGQELELYLDLWSDGFSFGDQLFALPEVKGGFLLQADTNTVKLNENRGGVQWQGLRYTFLFYPQREGRLEVPSFDVRFSVSAGYGFDAEIFQFQTPSLVVETRLPPGVDSNELLVTTSSFSMAATWTPQPADEDRVELKVGDAIKLEVKRLAQDVPGMVFAPLPDFLIDGLGVYPDTPQVSDRVNRGSLTGARTDSVTFIAQREGRYQIPGLRFQWWDPEQEVLAEKGIPALELEVIPNPAYASAATTATGKTGTRLTWKTLALVLALGWLALFPGRRFLRYLLDRLRNRRTDCEAGEPWAFKQVQKACGSGSPAETYNAITIWLSRLEKPGETRTLLSLAQATKNTALEQESIRLQSCVVSGSAAEWNGRELAQLLQQFRKRRKTNRLRTAVLPELNPRQL